MMAPFCGDSEDVFLLYHLYRSLFLNSSFLSLMRIGCGLSLPWWPHQKIGSMNATSYEILTRCNPLHIEYTRQTVTMLIEKLCSGHRYLHRFLSSTLRPA